MKNKLIVFLLALAMIFALAACGGGSDEQSESGSSEEATQETSEESAENAGDDADAAAKTAAPEDVVVDAEKGTVTITAQINATFIDQSTMHFCVNKDGSMGDKCMFAAYCSTEDFYNGMIEAGGEPWNTTSDKIKDGEFTDGQKVDVALTWEGQSEPVPMSDVLRSADGKLDVDMRFSGNLDNNKECGSGCIACLNSCWAGITSNAAYGYNAIDSGKVSAYLDESVVPADGTDVQITFTLK